MFSKVEMFQKIDQFITRSAAVEDRKQLANLLHFGAYIHRHLDWRQPLDWLGYYPFEVLEQGSSLEAALACPPDPPNVAWIRLFAVAPGTSLNRAWDELWPAVHAQLGGLTGPMNVAAIPLQSWFRKLLEKSDFTCTHKVVVLAWKRHALPAERELPHLTIRPMILDDLAEVEEIDSAAFGNVWQNSQSCLEIAFRQSTIATVAEISNQLVGYQISTVTAMGGHLARLAVRPGVQGKGVGYSLVRDMLSQFERRGTNQVTVNTQHDNLISLSLYEKVGFRRTGEEYPVYQYTSG